VLIQARQEHTQEAQLVIQVHREVMVHQLVIREQGRRQDTRERQEEVRRWLLFFQEEEEEAVAMEHPL